MRYDEKRDLILMDSKEFVSIARRLVSPSLSYDEDEPTLSELSKRRLISLVGSDFLPTAPVCYAFSDGTHNFEMTVNTEVFDGERLTVAREIESSPKHPKKSETAEIRGEGYIAAFVYAKQRELSSLNIRFVYMSAHTGEIAESTETVGIRRLEGFFNKCLSKVSAYAKPEIERVTVRVPSMKRLRFPYENVREGQHEFIHSAYRALSRGGLLYASAPTGTGKTVSALYPALRAVGDSKIEKVFYLTPKGTTAEAVRECLGRMESEGAVIRAIIITAKEKSCTRGLLCKRSRGLCENSKQNNLADAVLALSRSGICVATIDEIRKFAEQYKVCPYELALTYAELCDVVICDFNYLFDPVVYIKRFFTSGGKYAFLIDEAHNLPERARDMYSAEFSLKDFSLIEEAEELGEFSRTKKLAGSAKKVFSDVLTPLLRDELRRDKDSRVCGAVTLSDIPARIFSLFDEIISICEDEIFENNKAKDDEKELRLLVLRDFYYKTKRFSDILARFDGAYRMFVYYTDGEINVKLCCIDTGGVIRERLEKGRAGVLFSATLSPLDYYRSVLGGGRGDEILEVESPFSPEQLSVSIMDKISTRFSEREDTVLAVCRAIAATVSAKRGNYMIFSPSFAYSEALSRAFSTMYPKLHVITQTRNMTQKDKDEFLSHFRREDKSYLIAFCVMGGIYSEGIDLAGDSLIGAVIVGIGMPALSYEREAIAEYYQEKYEEGKQYAYIYPGMNRVFQAAGRVIRREDDRGVIVLIDDRFDDPIYKESLPSLWQGVKFIGDPKTLKAELETFWANN